MPDIPVGTVLDPPELEEFKNLENEEEEIAKTPLTPKELKYPENEEEEIAKTPHEMPDIPVLSNGKSTNTAFVINML